MDECMEGEPTRQSMRTAMLSNLGTVVKKVTGLEGLIFQLSESLVGPKPSDVADKKSPETPCDFVGQIRESLGRVEESITRSSRIVEELNQEFRNVK